MPSKRTYKQFTDVLPEGVLSVSDIVEADFDNIPLKCRVICKVCGYDRYQDKSSILKGIGCKKCYEMTGRNNTRMTGEVFLSNLFKRYPCNADKYTYDKFNYVLSTEKTEIGCKTCGKYFLQTPNDHYSGKGCPHCVGRNIDTEAFIKKVIKRFPINEQLYDYSQTIYTRDSDAINVGCVKCGGVFKQIASKHYQGHGCNLCSSTGFNNKSEGYFYITLWSKPEPFVKIGISSLSPQQRAYKQNANLNYEYKVVYSFKGAGSKVMSVEKQILYLFKGQRSYISRDCFPDGYTETFSVDLLDKLIKTAKELASE